MTKDTKKYSGDKGLDKTNSELLKFTYDELYFEIRGGVNPESYNSIHVMVFAFYGKFTARKPLDLLSEFPLIKFKNELADKFKLQTKYLDEVFDTLIMELENYKQELREQKSNKNKIVSLSDEQKKQAEQFLKEEDLLTRTDELIESSGVIGNVKNRMILFLVYLSRIQARPLHAIVDSRFNYLQTKIGELIPEEGKFEIGHLSENAIFYFDDGALANRVLLVEDTGCNKSKLLPLMKLQERGYLTKTVTQKGADGYLHTTQREVDGPICLSISTQEQEQFTSNRVLSFILKDDNSSKQDELLSMYQRKLAAGLVSGEQEQKAKSLLWNIQRVLEPMKVINPFAEKLLLPRELMHKQITTAHYLRFIEVITLFKQKQKEQKVDESTGEIYIETSIEDIEEANELIVEVMLHKSDRLTVMEREHLEKLKTLEGEFTNSAVSKKLRISISKVKRDHSTLEALGFIENTGGNRNHGYTFKVVNQNEFSSLQKSVADTLDESIRILRSSPKPKSAQSNSEPLKVLPVKENSLVAQKSNNNRKKAS